MIFNYAENLFQTTARAFPRLGIEAVSDPGELRIGALDSVPKQVLFELFAATLEKGAEKVTLVEDSADVLFRNLWTHRLDLVVTNHLPISEGDRRYRTKLLARVPVSVYGTKAYAHLREGFPHSLAAQPLIAPTPHSRLRHDLDDFFRTKGIPVRILGETQDTGLQRLLAIRGMGLVALADFTTRELVHAEKLVKLGTLPRVTEEIWLVSPEGILESPIAARILAEYSLKSLVAPASDAPENAR